MRLSLALVTALALLFVASCGDDAMSPRIGPDPPPPSPAAVAASVQLSPQDVSFQALGDSATLTATVRDQDGAVMPNPSVVWESSNGDAVSVRAGVVRALGNGESTITATSGSVSATASVRVAQVATSIFLQPDSVIFVSVGDTLRLDPRAEDANGHAMAVPQLTWSSDDEEVVRVDETGLLTAVGNGEAEVSAAASDLRAMATILVSQSINVLELSVLSLSFASLGDTARVAAVARDRNGNRVDAAIVWSSTDTTVATVVDGLVISVGNGEAEIRAQVGETAAAVFVLVDQVVADLVMEPAKVMFASLGDTARLVATGLDALGSAVADLAASWASTDAAVAAVDSTGLVTAVGNGEADVVASYEEWDAKAMVSVGQEIDRVEVPLDSINLRFPGDTIRIEARAYDAIGASIRAAAFTFRSSDATVATAGDDGLVTAVAAGEATVTVSLGDFTKAIPVRVTEDPMSVEITRDRIVFLYRHQYQEIRAVIRDGGGNAVAGEVDWSSTNPDVVRVPTRCGGTPGLAYPCARSLSEGTAVLVASVASTRTLVDSIPLAVAIASRIKLAGASVYQFEQPGAVFQIEAEVLRQDDTPIEHAPIQWSSAEPRVATVDSTGLVTVHEYGSTFIAIRAGRVHASVSIDVISPVVSVRVEPDSVTLNVIGDTAPIQLLGRPEFGGDDEILLSGRWKSSDTTIVAVKGEFGNAIATAKREGRAEIIGTHSEGDATFADTAIVLVDPVDRLTVTPSSLIFTSPGDKAQLQVQAFTRSGARLPEPGVTWASADVAVATVDSTGTVVARDYGRTSIRVRVGNLSETVPVTVASPAMFRLEVTPIEPAEGDTLTYTIVADSPPRVPVQLSYSLRSLDGVPDVTDPDGDVTFAAGATSLSLTFPILDDTDIEPPRDTLVMTLRDVVRGSAAIDTVLLKEGVCDRTPVVRNQIIFWAGYRDPMDVLEPDVTKCPEVTSEELASVPTLRLVSGEDLPFSTDMRTPISSKDLLDENTLTVEQFKPNSSAAAQVPPLRLTKEDLTGLDRVIEIWISGYDLRDVDWDEQIFSDLPIIEQIILSQNLFTDLPSTMFGGINTREAECPPTTLYDGQCRLVVLHLVRSRIEGTVSPDLLDPLPHLRVLFMVSLPDIASLSEGFFDDVEELGNLHLIDMPWTSLDADLLTNNRQLFNLVLDSLLLDYETTLPTGFLANQDSLLALNLARNGLTDIAGALPPRMPELFRLELDENAFASLPSGFLARFPGLESLDLSSNEFRSLPDGFFEGLTTEIQVLDLSDNPGPDGDRNTEDFSMTATLVRTDTSDVTAAGPATLAIDVPLGSPSDIAFDVFLFGASAGGSPVTPANQAAQGSLLLRAGTTRTEELQVTMVDTVPYFNVIDPSDQPNTSAEVTAVLRGGALDLSGLTVAEGGIDPLRLFASGADSADAISMPRLLQPLPTFRLLRGGRDYRSGSVANPDRSGRVTVDLADYFAARDESSTMTLYPDPNIELGVGVKQVFVHDTVSTSPLVVDTLPHPTRFVLDPSACGTADCFDAANTPYRVTIDAVDDTTFVTLRTEFEVEVAEVDTTKLNIEWVDVNGDLPAVVASAIDEAVARWGEILADLRDVRIPPTVAPRLGCFGARAPKHYIGIDDLLIWVVARHDDGPRGTLAAAAQCFLRDENEALVRERGLHQPLVGWFYLDLDDIPRLVESNLLVATVTHEIGHILGIGTGRDHTESPPRPHEGSWYGQGECAAEPTACFHGFHPAPYVPGPGAIAAFDSAGAISVEGRDLYFASRKVPIEPGRRSGSSGGHWSEEWLGNELMTPAIDIDSTNPLSKITARVFEDMGFTLRPGWEDAVDDYCLLSTASSRILRVFNLTHRCAPSMDAADRGMKDFFLSADDKVARGIGFDLRGDVRIGPLWVIGADGELRRIR